LPLRLLGIRTLLCDHCNYEFRAFAPRAPKRAERRATRKADVFSAAREVNLEAFNQPLPSANHAPAPPELRQQITEISSQASTEPFADLQGNHYERRPLKPSHVCPECGSHDIDRRHRRLWEKLLFAITKVRPYFCQNCGATFYARRKPRSKRHSSGSGHDAELAQSAGFEQE
jgi:hypothetical protein